MAKSVKSVKATAAVPDDQCFDWPISIQEGVARKRVPVKFPIDMRAVRAKERQRREQAERAAASRRGVRGKDEFVVAMGKTSAPHLVQAGKASKTTIAIVSSIFIVILLISVGLFAYFVSKDPK